LGNLALLRYNWWISINLYKNKLMPNQKGSIQRKNSKFCPHDCALGGNNKNPEWLVPYQDGYALIHHHHDDECDDHSVCGPTAFCCQQSADAFMERFPDSLEAMADWQQTDAVQMISWIDAGVPAIYFVFCSPDQANTLLVTGLSGDLARQTLLKELPLEQFVAESRVLAGPHPEVGDLSEVRPERIEPRPEFDIEAWKQRVHNVQGDGGRDE
jgi:hypothetical protein